MCVAGVTTYTEGMWQELQPAGRVFGRGYNLQGGCVAVVTTCMEGVWQGSQPAEMVCGRGYNLQGGYVAGVTTSRLSPVLETNLHSLTTFESPHPSVGLDDQPVYGLALR